MFPFPWNAIPSAARREKLRLVIALDHVAHDSVRGGDRGHGICFRSARSVPRGRGEPTRLSRRGAVALGSARELSTVAQPGRGGQSTPERRHAGARHSAV